MERLDDQSQRGTCRIGLLFSPSIGFGIGLLMKGDRVTFETIMVAVGMELTVRLKSSRIGGYSCKCIHSTKVYKP